MGGMPANIAHFDKRINQLSEQTDIIVLPEMFTTGFTMNPSKLAEEHGRDGNAMDDSKAKEKIV